MTSKEFLEFHKKCCEEMHCITAQKNADYSADSVNDAFGNFRLVEFAGAATVEQGFAVRMSDKYARICSFIKKGKLEVKDESVSDTLLDLANYCLLFMGYLQSKKEDTNKGML